MSEPAPWESLAEDMLIEALSVMDDRGLFVMPSKLQVRCEDYHSAMDLLKLHYACKAKLKTNHE